MMTEKDAFNITRHDNGIVGISFQPTIPQAISAKHMIAFLNYADHYFEQDDVSAIYYQAVHPQSLNDPYFVMLLQDDKRRDEYMQTQLQIDALLDKVRNYGKPLISVLQGDSLGNNLSWMIMADYSISIGSAGKVGFPEAAFGLFPSFGNITRMLQLWGEDFTALLAVQAKYLTMSDAISVGLVDEQIENVEQLPSSVQNYLTAPPLTFKNLNTIQQKNRLELPISRFNQHLPNTSAFLKLASSYDQYSESDELREQEHQAFVQLANSDQVIALVRTNYYGIREAKRQHTKGLEIGASVEKIGIIGAGMMGSGIAYESARSGLDVTLVDTEIAKADQGKSYSQKITDKLVAQGKMTTVVQSDLLQRIRTSEQFADVYKSDLVIEAVFEDLVLKTKLIAEVAPNLATKSVFASNTTSLPITQLALASTDAASFIGLHFFSPVERMPLVEVILGPSTSERTKQRALHYVHLLDKIPIVVKDGPGFFTSRLFFNYLLEGITMLLEGVPPAIVEMAAKEAGFPVGPLLVLDEISLPLMLHVYDQLPSLHEAQQAAYQFLQKMTKEKRNGRKGKAGFYEYDTNGKRQNIWEVHGVAVSTEYDLHELEKRLLHVVALDACRCLADGIISQPIDGDLGSVLGIGYAPHTGGVFAHIDQVGIANFIADCEEFAQYGAQWKIPDAMHDLARRHYKFYDRFRSNWNPS